MKNFEFIKKGRKIVFSLALFVLVFAAASAVKIQAAGNVTGWLWGGSEDANLGGVENCMIYPAVPGCIDGDETGLGWISMNCKDREAALGKTCKDKNDPTFNPATNLVDYGVTFPSSGNASGYAWSEWVGWIDFSGVTVSVAGSEKRLSGSAQIVSIVQAGANDGGWSGSIKMSGNGASWDGSSCTGTNDYGNNNRCNYGVKINSSGDFSGKAWNGEELGSGANMANGFGWIDFAGAKIEGEPCTIAFEPESRLVNENTSGISVTLKEVPPSGVTTCNSGTVTLAKNDLIVNSMTTPIPSPFDFSSDAIQSVSITLGIGGVSSYTVFSDALAATSTKVGPANFELDVQNIPACTISAPDSVTVSSNSYVDYDVTVTGGDAECSTALLNCSRKSGDSNISIENTPGETRKCRVRETAGKRFGTAISHAQIGAGLGADTNVNVKGPGWIETNP